MKAYVARSAFLLLLTTMVAAPAQAQDLLLVVHSINQQTELDDVVDKLGATGAFAAVYDMDVTSTTPSAATLSLYDKVLAFTDKELDDAAGLGDVLADYVDGGGALTVAAFANRTGYAIGGRLDDEDYLAFDPGDMGDVLHPQNLTLVAQPGWAGSELLSDVVNFNGGLSSFRCDSTLVGGAYDVAHWSDDLPMVAFVTRSDRITVSLNLFPPSSDSRYDYWDASTDGVQLLVNAIRFSGEIEDRDGDGYATWQGDCDDDDPARNPGEIEVCDGVDNNCNGVVPPDETDDDGDGFT